MKIAGLDATLSPYKNVGAAISLQQVIMVKPTTVDHILKCLEIARDSDVHVRPVGSGQSSSQLYPDEGHVLLDMLNYRNGRNEPIDRRVITIPPSERIASWQARVVCNVRVKELNAFLEPHGLFLPSTTSSVNPTVAGLVATASHGSNWKDDSIAHYVTAMTVVKSDGTIQEYNILNNALVMGALRSCLGACGVITDVTLAVKPLGRCSRTLYSHLKLQDLFNNTQNLEWLTINSFSWDATWHLLNSGSPKDPTKPKSLTNVDLISWTPSEDLVDIRVFKLLAYQTSLSDRYKQGINEGLFESLVKNSSLSSVDTMVGSFSDLVHSVDTDNETYTGLDVEFAVNDDSNTYNGSIMAVQVLTDVLSEWATTRGVLPLERIDFGWQQHSTSPCCLCPSQVSRVSKPVFTINMHVNIGAMSSSTTEAFCKQVYTELKSSGFRVFPHLGKHHSFLTDFLNTDLHEDFKEGLQALVQTRQLHKLDKTDLFLNSYLKNFFKPDYLLPNSSAMLCFYISYVVIGVYLSLYLN